jgi:hypothetical protein
VTRFTRVRVFLPYSASRSRRRRALQRQSGVSSAGRRSKRTAVVPSPRSAKAQRGARAGKPRSRRRWRRQSSPRAMALLSHARSAAERPKTAATMFSVSSSKLLWRKRQSILGGNGSDIVGQLLRPRHVSAGDEHRQDEEGTRQCRSELSAHVFVSLENSRLPIWSAPFKPFVANEDKRGITLGDLRRDPLREILAAADRAHVEEHVRLLQSMAPSAARSKRLRRGQRICGLGRSSRQPRRWPPRSASSSRAGRAPPAKERDHDPEGGDGHNASEDFQPDRRLDPDTLSRHGRQPDCLRRAGNYTRPRVAFGRSSVHQRSSLRWPREKRKTR